MKITKQMMEMRAKIYKINDLAEKLMSWFWMWNDIKELKQELKDLVNSI